MHGGDIILIVLAFLYSKLGSTAKYLANPPCKDEPTDADQEDKEAELLVTRSQCVNNRLHNKSTSVSKNIFELFKTKSSSNYLKTRGMAS